MRHHAYGVVVLLRAEPERARADFFQELEEGGDARVAIGRRCCWFARVGRIGDERVGGIAEEVGVGLRDAGDLAGGEKFSAAACAMRSLVLQASVTRACLGAWRAISGRRSMVTPMGRAM